MVEEEKAESVPAPAKGGGQMKLVIVGAAALFVALVGAQVAAPLINAMIAGAAQHAAESAEGPPSHGEAAVAAAPRSNEPLAPALYVALDPPFVVSFDQEDGARYLQLTLQAMARDEKTVAAVKQHAPAIRNAVLFLLSGYELPALATQAGKEELRIALRKATNEILAKNRVTPGIEDLYFTSIVIQ